MKFLEFQGAYTQFQTGVLKEFLARRYTPEQREAYMEKYWDWKRLGLSKAKADKTRTTELKAELDSMEEGYSYETILVLR